MYTPPSTMGAKSRFMLVEKEGIVAEAYSKSGNSKKVVECSGKGHSLLVQNPPRGKERLVAINFYKIKEQAHPQNREISKAS
jgi:hypothetical protein